MPLLGDRVQETTTSAGTGSLTLNGAVTGYVTFNSTFNNGDIVWYVIDDGVGNWEIGYGTVGTGTLTRTVFQSSNANALVNFAAGTKRVFCTAPYTYLLPDQTSNSGKILITDGTTSSWTSDYAGLTSANTFTNTQIINAQVGIGGAPSAGRTLSVTKDITGALQSVGVYSGGTTQSDVTARTDMFRSTASTAAAAFTLLSLRHYTAQQGTFGAGSSVSYQYGFLADSSLTGATVENYGFYSNISSGTGRYNFYAAGTASNYLAGALGIGTTSLTGYNFRVGGSVTGATTAWGVASVNTGQSDVTANFGAYYSQPSTQATAYTLSNLYHYNATQGTIGAGSTVTNQYSFFANSANTGATNNYGFYSNISSGTGRYNFYAAGTADNYLAGSLGIGATPSAGRTLTINANITGSTAGRGCLNNGTIQSDVTSNAYVYVANPATAAAAFTLPTLGHFYANQGTIGAGSAITSQYGFLAESSLTGATNNYGFYSNIASGTGRYNFYSAGTADNYFAGKVGVGVTGSLSGIANALAITGGVNAQGYRLESTINSDVTGSARGYVTFLSTQASAFTVGNLYHYYANQVTIGAGSAVLNQAGFCAENNLTGATNDYGFYSNIASGSGRYNFYAAGSAANYFAGDVTVASTNDPAFSVTGGVRIGSSTATGSTRITSGLNWNFSPLSIIRATSNSATVRTLGFMLDGDSLSSTGIGDYNAIWGAYDSAPTTGSTSSALNGAMVYGAYAGHRWYVNGSERMRIDNAGRVGIGGTPSAGRNLELLKALTGDAFSYNLNINYSIQSDVVSEAASVQSYVGTQAAAFTLSNLRHFKAVQTTIGAGSSIFNQVGFWADGTLTGATNNYGFYSNIASGTNRWNFYAAGTASNYLAGALGIGTTSLTGIKFNIGGNWSDNGGYALQADVTGTITSSTVTEATAYYTNFATQAAAFTLANLYHYRAAGVSVGAGSTVSNQFGFRVESSLTGATNNYGFYSNIASGSNRYNFYSAGTADNYFAGKIGIGGVPTTFVSADIQGTYPAGSFTRGFRAAATIPSSVVGNARLFSTEAYTEAASFTLTALTHYLANQQTIGAGSTVTTQYGFSAETTLTGATNNYGFYSNIASGTGRYNFYAAGTAANYFAGQIQLAANKELIVGGTDTANNPQLTSDGTYLQLNAPNASGDIRFRVAGAERFRMDSSGNTLNTGSGGLGYGTGSGGAVTQTTSRTTGVTLNKTNGAITLVSAAGSATYQTFTVTNSTVAATDVIHVSQKSGTDKYIILVTAVAAGSFAITFATTGGTTTEQPVFNFAVLKAVTA